MRRTPAEFRTGGTVATSLIVLAGNAAGSYNELLIA